MLIHEASASRIGRTGCSGKRYLPGFPAKRVCKDPTRHPKANNISWNVVGLDAIVRIVIINVSPTTKLNFQLTTVPLLTNTVPADTTSNSPTSTLTTTTHTQQIAPHHH